MGIERTRYLTRAGGALVIGSLPLLLAARGTSPQQSTTTVGPHEATASRDDMLPVGPRSDGIVVLEENAAIGPGTSR